MIIRKLASKAKKLLLVALLGALVMSVLPDLWPESNPAQASSATNTAISMTVGDKLDIGSLNAAYTASNCKVKSSKKSVVTYKKGIFTAKKKGSATITVTYGGKKTKYKFTVAKKTATASSLSITMIDVGQGDSFLIQADGYNILCDTGEYKMYSRLKDQLDKLGVTKIDALILSHFDTDHFGSAQSVLKDYGKDMLCVHPSRPSTSNTYKYLMDAISKYGYKELTLTAADEGKEIKELAFGELKFKLLSADAGEDTNDSSLVFRVEYGKTAILLTGDASAKVLNDVMAEYPDEIKADIFKVSHHGSAYSNPVLFIKNVGAKYALIGVGEDNIYGHPVPEVITRLEKYTDKIYRADLDGMVTLVYDGSKWNKK